MRHFGSSGIRDVMGRELLRTAFDIGIATGHCYPSVVVGRDTRTSSDALQHALLCGLLAGGSRAYDAGLVPTPTLAYAARRFDAGAMVTASHNPPHYNGIKLVNADGSAFHDRQRHEIERLMAHRDLSLAPWDRMQDHGIYSEAIREHVDRLAESFRLRAGLKLVLDCGCGAASLVTPHLLGKLGCELITLHCYPSGHFPRGSEPTPDSLQSLVAVVKQTGADLGIAHDGDGDRMMAIDDLGRFVPGDVLFALFALCLKSKKVVTTVDASMALDDLGLEVIRTKVGDANVSEVLLSEGGDFGGEPCGAWVFPQISYCPDGIYAAAQIAQIASENRLSGLVDEVPRYSVVRGSVVGVRDISTELEDRLMSMRPLSISAVDGMRLDFGDGWVLVRGSGTEPKIRVTAEARTEERAQELYRATVASVRECMATIKAGPV